MSGMGHAAPRDHERDVTIPGGLRGIWTEPGASSAEGRVVLLHGFTGHRDEAGGSFAVLAARLAARGIASLRIDFPGCGDSPGDFADITIAAYADAGRQALDFARTCDGADAPPIGVLGFSFGGAIATAVVDGAPEPRALALWAPVIDPAGDMISMLGAERAAEAERTGIVSMPWGGGEIRLKRAFFRSLATVAPLARLAAFEGDLLVIVGSEDRLARHLDSVKGAARRARRVETVRIDGADHFFGALRPDRGSADAVAARTAAFFAESLAAG